MHVHGVLNQRFARIHGACSYAEAGERPAKVQRPGSNGAPQPDRTRLRGPCDIHKARANRGRIFINQIARQKAARRGAMGSADGCGSGPQDGSVAARSAAPHRQRLKGRAAAAAAASVQGAGASPPFGRGRAFELGAVLESQGLGSCQARQHLAQAVAGVGVSSAVRRRKQ